MLKKAVKEELCQISLTGIRSLTLLGLLIEEPRSLEDIRNAFMDFNIMEGSNSDDILRIDINTLKSIGCEISRADHRTNNKYVLSNHPFKININEEELKVLKSAFNKIKENADINLLLQYDRLFKKVAAFAADDSIKEYLLGLSPLKSYKSNIINDLKSACDAKNVITILYRNSETKVVSEKEIIADSVILQNNKLYLYGIDKNIKKSVYLNIKRIQKIISQTINEDDITGTPVMVKFWLRDFGVAGLDENENILSGDISNGFIIEGKYFNEFLAVQRILSFGSNCKVLEPTEFKNKIIEILKRMKEIYNG